MEKPKAENKSIKSTLRYGAPQLIFHPAQVKSHSLTRMLCPRVVYARLEFDHWRLAHGWHR